MVPFQDGGACIHHGHATDPDDHSLCGPSIFCCRKAAARYVVRNCARALEYTEATNAMLSSLVGMAVSRAIPKATLAGQATGRYALHGGVVRWAAGTAHAGQIVAHLPVSACGKLKGAPAKP